MVASLDPVVANPAYSGMALRYRLAFAAVGRSFELEGAATASSSTLEQILWTRSVSALRDCWSNIETGTKKFSPSRVLQE